VGFIVLTILFSIALFYFIKAGKNLALLSEKLQESFNDSEEFILELKERLENNPILNFFFPLIKKKKTVKKVRNKK
ncbi:MAG: hypothetical protein WA019_02075, partial [Candidatus Moraniibacteriota bacterium]